MTSNCSTRFFAPLLALLILCSVQNEMFAQSYDTTVIGATEVTSEYKGETQRLDEYVADPTIIHPVTKSTPVGYHPKGDWPQHPKTNPNALPIGSDPVWQQNYPTSEPISTDSSGKSSALAIGVNLEGLSASGFSPGDPSMDAGPNHVIQMTNGQSGAIMRIWDKSGNPLTAQIQFDTFFEFAGGGGDPIVLYDHAADRWILTEFKSKALGISEGQHELYIAVSTTADPLGTYYTYTMDTPGFPDYPHYSMWSDMYLITTNESACGFYTLDRTSMLAGNPTNAQRFETPDIGLGFLAGAPVHWDGDTPPPAGQNAIAMRMKDDGWNGVATDALEFWELDIDFDNAANSSLSLEQELSVSPFDTELCGYTDWACIEQPNGAELLDPLLEILMNRVQYRNFGTHESIVCCHTTDADGSDRAGIRWYELRRTGGDWSVHQEGTYSPDDAGRFMGSIAMDDEGNIALGFNISSTTIFPSIRYTGRSTDSPLGQMTWGETSLQEGTGTNWSNRYGDYNQLVWDPASDSFWMTAMYNDTENWKTRVAQFSMPEVEETGPGCTDPLACNFDSGATIDNGSCLFGGATVTIATDDYPAETTWVLTDNVTGDIVYSGGPYQSAGTTDASDLCLAAGCYTFTIFDEYGDGICCWEGDGAYAVTNALGEILASGGEFGFSASTEVCICIPQLWYDDFDGDGFGDINPDYQATSCEMPTVTNSGETFTSAILIGGDCNDEDAAIFPQLWYDDYDGDGFGDINPDYQATSCGVPSLTNNGQTFTSAILIGGDCNDGDLYTFPGSAEIDSDTQCMKDADNDGYGDNSAVANAPGWVTNLSLDFPEFQLYDGTDCHDGNSGIHPGAVDILNNGIDENCDGQDAISICGNGIVEPGEECDDGNFEGNDGCFNCQIFADDDGDEYYADVDCDDNNSSVGADLPCPELNCFDGVDNDADGFIDCNDSDCSEACTELNCFDGVDNDYDGFIDCDDSDCYDVCTELNCFDGVDNNYDGFIDCDDSDCSEACTGCDGVLNSGLVNDECGVCGGDNSSCAGGCTYPQACNYDSVVDIDDGSCIFAEDCEICDGIGGVTANDLDQDGVCDEDEVPGCMDSGYLEFNPLATDDDGSCLIVMLEGCTYANAENYNISATNENGTCTFGSTTGSGCGSLDCPDLNCDGQVGVADLIGLLAGFDTTCDMDSDQ